MPVTFFQEHFGAGTTSSPPDEGEPFYSLYTAVLTGTVGIYDVAYTLAAWGALIFLIVAIISFFMSTRGPHRDQAKAKVVRELIIFIALSCILGLVAFVFRFASGLNQPPGRIDW